MDVEATPARLSQEIVAAKIMLARAAEQHGFRPVALAVDKSYGTGTFLAWLLKREIAPHVPVLDRQQQTDGKYDLSYFAYDADRDSFTCLDGHGDAHSESRFRDEDQALQRKHQDLRGSPDPAILYSVAPARTETRQMDEDPRQIARELSKTEKFETSRRKGKMVEMPFAHLLRNLGFTRLRLRGLRGASDEFLLAATAQNLNCLAKLARV